MNRLESIIRDIIVKDNESKFNLPSQLFKWLSKDLKIYNVKDHTLRIKVFHEIK